MEDTDSFSELTAMLHRAYADLARQGFRYVATSQDEATTRRRCGRGECWVALAGGRPVGTITLVRECEDWMPEWYGRPDVVHFEQLGVDPRFQGRGVGTRLLERVERRAVELGARELALDTAEGAVRLVEMYEARGFRLVATADWSETNYRSVILSKPLA